MDSRFHGNDGRKTFTLTSILSRQGRGGGGPGRRARSPRLWIPAFAGMTVALRRPHERLKAAATFPDKVKGGFETRPYGTT